jgi:hypothetical protein
VADPANRLGQLAGIEHSVFEEIPAALLVAVEQPDRVLGLDVLGEDEHADVGPAAADRVRGDEALVRVGGGHADVDDRDVGCVSFDAAQQLLTRGDLRDDVEVLVDEQARDALA